MVIDGNHFGLANTADALRIMKQFIARPEQDDTIDVREAQGGNAVVSQDGKAVMFGIGGEGLPGLLEGWGQPEKWGTWSVAKRALLRIRIGSASRSPLFAILTYRS